ncbi:MAG TPA: SIS domain-containing protein [Candidatus Limnocylindrales bacterium]|jgi:fructoselysine-6-P-deglycase FrlB-like protein|nr:SIS domain-containing protein [Candidatus Limnocylindrales bacterium]
MDATTFDPTAPLPGPPDPWASTDRPSPRGAAPYHMTEMIDAEPALAERILEHHAAVGSPAAELARTIRRTIRAGDPVIVTGCGTSEHAALGVVEILRDAIKSADIRAPGHATRREPTAAQAFELSLDPPSSGLVIAISHEGATTATNAALAAARSAGARTALVTVSDRSPGADLADIVVDTGELDQSWCHTVGYVSPLVAGVAIGAHLTGRPVDAPLRAAVRDLLAAGVDRSSIAEAVAGRLSRARGLLVIASGADRSAGRELALKIEEGTWIPAAFRDVETFLHGHLAATDEQTGLVLVLADRHRRTERLARAAGALRAARAIGIETAAIISADAAIDLPTELTTAGRTVVPEAPDLPTPVAALLGTATPIQILTERVARARGVNPDPIHRDDERYRLAADAADATDAAGAEAPPVNGA